MQAEGDLALPDGHAVHVERTRQKQHGDFACSVALSLAKIAKTNPRALAESIIASLPQSDLIERVEIAGPGFINFFVTRDALNGVIDTIRKSANEYGKSTVGGGQKVMVEFVSANPNGPLHVGHGRGAAYGDTLARILQAAGYEVYREYYFNDAGRQMDILALSVWLRYLELCGESIDFPANAYQGDYIFDIAADIHREHGGVYARPVENLFVDLPDDADKSIDSVIESARELLGEGYQTIFTVAKDTMVEVIRKDLTDFRIEFDRWFSEQSLVDDGTIERALSVVQEAGHLYDKDGAVWFRSSEFGDEKDRVVRRSNGTHTYFAADIGYLLNKMERGFAHLIYVWGADHHGMVPRLNAAYKALGFDEKDLTVLLVQFAVLYRGGKKVSMSTRSGEFVTLRELREEVGNDAARFFYVQRKSEQHMDFDMDLAKSQSSENPVYYVQYAHARVCSVFNQLKEKGLDQDWESGVDYNLLIEDHEFDLLNDLSRFPEVVEAAAMSYEPHQIAYYLRELANSFHTYYNAHPFIASDAPLRAARLGLIDAARQVIANGLDLLGVSAPTSM